MVRRGQDPAQKQGTPKKLAKRKATSNRREGKEVRTREEPEDDVPGEYLDEK